MLFQTNDRDWMIHRHGPSTRADALPDLHQADAGRRRASCRPTTRTGPFEIKWDGVRAILFVEGGRVRAQSRNDLDVTVSFPELADIGEFLGMTTCVHRRRDRGAGRGWPARALPGCSSACTCRTSARRSDGRCRTRSAFVAFDLLYLRRPFAADVRSYDERRDQLESLHLSGDDLHDHGLVP